MKAAAEAALEAFQAKREEGRLKELNPEDFNELMKLRDLEVLSDKELEEIKNFYQEENLREIDHAQYKKYSYPSAKEYYKKAISYDKNMLDAYNNLGVLLTMTGDMKGAEKSLKTCISINPDYATAYKNLGILYDTKMKKNSDAVENYKKYLSLRPDCPERGLVKLWISVLGG